LFKSKNFPEGVCLLIVSIEGGNDGGATALAEEKSKPTSPRKTTPFNENKESQKDKEVRIHKDNFSSSSSYLTKPKETSVSTTSNSPTSVNTNTNTNVASSSPSDTTFDDVEKKIRAGIRQ
jgi:hypothetical protein